MSQHGCMKRADELHLKDLHQRVEDDGRCSLTEDEQLTLSLLEDRYAKFLDDGIKKLREASDRGGGSSNSSASPLRRIFGGKGSDPRFGDGGGSESDASLTSPRASTDVDPASFCSDPLSPGETGSGNHWTWVTESLVVGAIPYASTTHDRPGHLSLLLDQCYERRRQIAMVVSCLEPDEAVPAGFATPKDWETQLGAQTFIHLAFPSKADTPIEESTSELVLAVCAQMGASVSATETAVPSKQQGKGWISKMTGGNKAEKKPAVFVHCKAGTQRSWIVAMCFLMSQRNVSYGAASAKLKAARPLFKPTEAQVEFVKQFSLYITSATIKAKNENEEKYVRVLADVLSLPQPLRLRLLRDLEKLT